MTTIRFALLSIAVTGGCSIIYNPDKIPTQSDAPIDAVLDADPSHLMILDAGPARIFEGQGDNGSRPAMIVVHGFNFVPTAQVALTSTTTSVKLDVDNANLKLVGIDYIAVPVIAHVDTNLTDGVEVPLTVAVSQPVGDGTMVTQTLDGQISLHGYDELNADLADWSQLKQRYSVVNLTNPNLAAGASSVRRIWSASSISIGTATAHGGNGSGTNGAAAVAGGCPGGAGLMSFQCGGAGGPAAGNLVAGGGGGGAGFVTNGLGGGGTSGGSGGGIVGDAVVADLTTNISGGGGGGAGALLNAAGGGGGGGGGMVVLYADGDLTVGTVDVKGGTGATSGGSGGSGAGGVIIVHSGRTLSVTTTLTSQPGAVTGNGGGSSVGKIRWDAPGGAAPTSSPPAVRGINFATTTPFVVTDMHATLPVVGTPNHTLNVSAVDQQGNSRGGDQGVPIGAGGTTDINVTWTPGFNHVCITLQPGGLFGTLEADTCVDVAYLP